MRHGWLFLSSTRELTYSSGIISAYFQYKPSCYRKCNEGADVDEEDDDQVADPRQPSLRGVLQKRNKERVTVFKGNFSKQIMGRTTKTAKTVV